MVYSILLSPIIKIDGILRKGIDISPLHIAQNEVRTSSISNPEKMSIYFKISLFVNINLSNGYKNKILPLEFTILFITV